MLVPVVVAMVALVFVVPSLRGGASGTRYALKAAALGDGYVVVGASTDHDTAEPMAWKVTGSRWQRLGDARADRQLTDVVTVGDRVVAVGSARGRPAVFERDAADGRGNWRAVWTMDVSTGVAGELTAVAVTPARVVAVGHVFGDGTRTAIAVSAVGSGPWEPVTIADQGTANAITTSADGFVAVGQAQDAAAAAWHSADGVAWKREAMPDMGARRAWVTAVARAAGTQQIVAVGQSDAVPSVWRRVDGAWTFDGALPGATARGQTVAAIGGLTQGGAFLVGGREIGIGDVSRPLAWASDDGRTWRRVAVADGRDNAIVDVLASDAGFVAVGNVGKGEHTKPVLYRLRGTTLTAT
jgi:hypothetical protein